jgi:hypothetical protein
MTPVTTKVNAAAAVSERRKRLLFHPTAAVGIPPDELEPGAFDLVFGIRIAPSDPEEVLLHRMDGLNSACRQRLQIVRQVVDEVFSHGCIASLSIRQF